MKLVLGHLTVLYQMQRLCLVSQWRRFWSISATDG